MINNYSIFGQNELNQNYKLFCKISLDYIWENIGFDWIWLELNYQYETQTIYRITKKKNL